MEIDHDRFERAVAEVGGDLADRSTAFEHVGGVAVTQRVNAEDLVFFVETAFDLGEIERRPDTRLAHRFGMRSESLFQRVSLLLPSAPHAGEEPLRVAVSAPERAEALVQLRRDRHLASLAALAFGNADDKALTVDVFGFDVNGLAQTEAALIDNGEVGAVAAVSKGAQEQGDFFP